MLHELTNGQFRRSSGGPLARRKLVGIPALLTLLVSFVVVPLTAWAEEYDAPSPARVSLPVVGEIELCLVCPPEVLEMEHLLFARLSHLQEEPCRRPVLRGEPLPGSARQEMETLFLQKDEQMRQRMDLLRSDDGDLLSEYLKGDRPADDLVERTVRLFEDLVPVVLRAVTHEDACGVYLPTLELSQDVSDTLSALRVFKGLSILLRTWSEQGREDEALKLGLDLIRLSQDLVRGEGGSLIQAMLRLAILAIVVKHGMRVALSEGKLPRTRELERAERETALLLRTEPPDFGRVLAFDTALLGLNLWLPCLKGDKWRPPERFRAFFDSTLSDHAEAAEYPPAIRWTMCATGWLGSNLLADAIVRACPPGANGLECVAGMRREVEKQEWKLALPAVLTGALLSGRPFKYVRDVVVEAPLVTAALPAYEKYAHRWACNSFLTAALRLHLRLLVHSRRLGQCPSAKDLRSAEWADVVMDPNVGQPMHIAIEQDLYAVRTAPFRTSEGIDQDYCQDYFEKAYVIRCRTGQLGDHVGNGAPIAREGRH